MVEIERKFLVTSDVFKKKAFKKERIVQGFLNTHPERTVRVRIKGRTGYLTVKGVSNLSGTTRFEWETTIAVGEAQELLNICQEGIIEKIRYSISFEGHIYEVDEFLGQNMGLIMAEVELKDENETLTKPAWLGDEVTGKTNYYNSQLSIKPFKIW